MNKRIKIAAIAIGVLFIASIAFFAFPKSYIKLSIAPDSAQLSIDGGSKRNVTNGSTILVIAGKHTYTLSRDQFDSASVTITSGNNQTKQLLLALNPRTDAAEKLLETNSSSLVIETIGDGKERQGEATTIQNYPILQDLPIYESNYELTSCPSRKYPNDPTKVALCVYTDADQSAIEPLINAEITQLGYNPSTFEIIYQAPPQTNSVPTVNDH